MIRILFLLGLSFGPNSVEELRLNESAIAVAGVPCNQDCIWSAEVARWVCVAGSVGWGCKEQAGGGCSYYNCFSYVRIDATGALSGLALCESEMNSLIAYNDFVGGSATIDEALKSGFLTGKVHLPIGTEN